MKYYFDMDGTLSIYDKTMEDKTLDYHNRPINQLGTHYFRTLQPNPQMQKVINLLMHYNKDVYLVSHSTNDLKLATEHLHDKQIWLSEHYPMLTADQILWIPCQTITKPDAVTIMTNHSITEDDILIDDFNMNLNDWKSAGGTAIKFLNNCNSPDSFDGIHITPDMTTSKIIDLLMCDVKLMPIYYKTQQNS